MVLKCGEEGLVLELELVGFLLMGEPGALLPTLFFQLSSGKG